MIESVCVYLLDGFSSGFQYRKITVTDVIEGKFVIIRDFYIIMHGMALMMMDQKLRSAWLETG